MSRMTTSGLETIAARIARCRRPSGGVGSFGPYCCSRAAASEEVSDMCRTYTAYTSDANVASIIRRTSSMIGRRASLPVFSATCSGGWVATLTRPPHSCTRTVQGSLKRLDCGLRSVHSVP